MLGLTCPAHNWKAKIISWAAEHNERRVDGFSFFFFKSRYIMFMYVHMKKKMRDQGIHNFCETIYMCGRCKSYPSGMSGHMSRRLVRNSCVPKLLSEWVQKLTAIGRYMLAPVLHIYGLYFHIWDVVWFTLVRKSYGTGSDWAIGCSLLHLSSCPPVSLRRKGPSPMTWAKRFSQSPWRIQRAVSWDCS